MRYYLFIFIFFLFVIKLTAQDKLSYKIIYDNPKDDNIFLSINPFYLNICSANCGFGWEGILDLRVKSYLSSNITYSKTWKLFEGINNKGFLSENTFYSSNTYNAFSLFEASISVHFIDRIINKNQKVLLATYLRGGGAIQLKNILQFRLPEDIHILQD